MLGPDDWAAGSDVRVAKAHAGLGGHLAEDRLSQTTAETTPRR